MNTDKVDRPIINWLYLIGLMVFCMVFVGGITRLTDSGLSIVDWKPIMGILPPLTHEQWLISFQKYQQFPEYNLINHQMDLAGFKSIFFWEYFHRLFGRLIGLVFFFPYLYFFYKKRISKKLNKKLLILFFLGGLQGLMGWYMVKSGLVNKPDVSHFRLAAHLFLAFIIIGYALFITLTIKYPHYRFTKKLRLKKSLLLFFILICVQIIYGAFVAGLDAGLTHNTFPKMGRYWLPNFDYYVETGFLKNVLNNSVLVQFIHRCFAWFLLFNAIVLAIRVKRVKNFLQRRSIQFVLIMLLIQFVLGVITLIYYVPISIASIHQIGATALMLLCVRSLFFTFSVKTEVQS